jgi:lipopolysaccharide export LptBFGC system permease protein LptF
MPLLDRYILGRFLVNFAILFTLLFLFGAGIDLILNLDEFTEVARERSGEVFTWRGFALLLGLMANFQLPRLFLFYAYMHGLVAIGAMGFTLAQMYRHRELLALLASGLSLHRVAMPFVVGVFLVSLLQLLNQEFVLHRVAPLILRGHGEIGERSLEVFPVPFTNDGRGNLVHSPAFDPATSTMSGLTILERDERGRTTRRITAEQARWDERDRVWRLTAGRAVSLQTEDQMAQQPIDAYPTDLDPRALTVQRHGQYAAMLSLAQIQRMLASPRVTEDRALLRFRYARFATIVVNLLVLAIALPAFLLREPTSLMRQSLLCSALAIPALMGAALGMTMELPGISPAVGVFLPVVVLIPVAAARWTFLRT